MATADNSSIRKRSSCRPPLTGRLQTENRQFRGTGGISEENGSAGFAPAFMDAHDGRIYRSQFADGRAAPIHVLDALPEHLVSKSSATGEVIAVRDHLVSGFLRAGIFYTRTEAARAKDRQPHA